MCSSPINFIPLTKTSYSAERGATLVETVLMLPVLLLLIFFCIWLGVMSNAKAAFNTSLTNALRLAATRSNPFITNKLDAAGYPSGVIPEIESVNWTGGITSPPAALQALLSWDTQSSPWTAPVYQYYQSSLPTGSMRNITSHLDLSALPPEYVYTLIYIYQALRQSLGNGVKYPCNPNLNTAGNGPGCLVCYFIDPSTPGNLTQAFAVTTPVFSVGVACEYQPDATATRLTFAMIQLVGRLFGGSAPVIILRDQKYFDYSTGSTS